MSEDGDDLKSNIKDLRDEIARLNNHRFIRIHNSTLRLVWFQFLRGLAFGFGSVVGASIVVSIVAFILNQIDFVPIVGDWAKQIAAEILSNTTRVETGE
ncbi:DUF5665 domain-containing protein [Celeribacter indicus]|uniref:Uncharacterized protein n=1 Tax=Celeribacter indicus TaxID=1208324 RepID=A0A0B5DPV2_9RHOB|nr:DUF5665 domain-containing protein [Celeribacter indicus]AJE45149.1 hypothetical protein P73_0434 [Celeribacter indicus]SDX26363.1 hypothetical protein SAMN05443573_11934 [Celeribacter indicus]